MTADENVTDHSRCVESRSVPGRWLDASGCEDYPRWHTHALAARRDDANPWAACGICDADHPYPPACPHIRVNVQYTVPVYAVLEGDEVGRVVVHDEGIQVDKTTGAWCQDCDTELPVDHPRTITARKAADSAYWPGWTFGW